MTPEAKTPADVSTDSTEEKSDRRLVYETPVLVPLGNVHALLAGRGHSITTDGSPGTMRLP